MMCRDDSSPVHLAARTRIKFPLEVNTVPCKIASLEKSVTTFLLFEDSAASVTLAARAGETVCSLPLIPRATRSANDAKLSKKFKGL